MTGKKLTKNLINLDNLLIMGDFLEKNRKKKRKIGNLPEGRILEG